MPDRLRRWASGVCQDPVVRYAGAAFLALRGVTLVWAVTARTLAPGPFTPDPVLRPYVGVAVEPRPMLEPWQRWDTLHYQAIAERGYGAFDTTLFTPPLYPLLMAGVGWILGGDTLLGGILVSNVVCLLGLIALGKLALLETGDLATSRRTVLYMASFPAAFFLVAAYAESLFLLSAALVFIHMRRQQWLRAGFWAAVIAMTRSTGVLILIPLAFQIWPARQDRRALAALVLGVAGALALPLVSWLGLGLPPWQPWIVLGQRAGGGFAVPGWNLIEAVRQIAAGDYYLADAFDLLSLLVFTALLVPVWKSLPRIHAVYALTYLALYLSRVARDQPLLATTRYVLALLPAFIVLGMLGRRAWVHRLILYPSWAGLLLLSGQFAIWGWVG